MSKKYKIIIQFILITLTVVLVMFWIKPNKEIEQKKRIQKTQKVSIKELEKPSDLDKKTKQGIYIFILSPISSRQVSFEIGGNLESYTWKKGDSFKKDDVLFQLNNSILFNQIIEIKKQLKNNIEENLNQIKDENFKQKWRDFSLQIKETDLLPEVPSLYAKGYQEIQINNKIVLDIKQIQTLESQIFDYFYLAPFDGEFTEVSNLKKVKKRQVVAEITTLKNVLLQTQISKNEKENIEQQTDFKIKNTNQTLKLDFQFEALKNTDSLLVFSKIKKSTLKKYQFGDSLILIPLQKNESVNEK
ncbi:MAG: hypothetical protein V4622_12475 [Bacteroidota bacterium]